MLDRVIAREADVDNQAGDIGDGIDADILIVTVGQTSKVDLEIVEEIWESFVDNSCVS